MRVNAIAGTVIFIASALVSCRPLPPSTTPIARIPNPVEPAIAAEYRPFQQAGTGRVAGQAFMRTRGGDVKLAAGNSVRLDPITTYSREWYRLRGRDVRYFHTELPDTLFNAVRREQRVDAQGKFAFADLAPGWYFVTTYVQWETGATYGGMQGGVVSDSVQVKNGTTVDVILTR